MGPVGSEISRDGSHGRVASSRLAPPGAGPSPRVIHVITSLEEGGAQAMLCKLLSAQGGPPAGTRVVALTDGGAVGARIAALGVPVLSLGMKRGRPSAGALFRLARLLRAERPDLVQTWLYHADLLGGIAAGLVGIPVVWGIRHDKLLEHDSRLTRLTRRACGVLSWFLPERIVCNSEAARRTHAASGYAPGKLVVIPNGFDLDRFRPSAEARSAVRRELGLDDGAVLVGLVARFDPHKDHATFFAAAARIRDRLGAVHFVLCGEAIRRDNPELARLVEGAGLEASTHLLGTRPDVERVTAALDVACLTSTTESFPNVVGEAMACGVPCVATDCGDVREIMGDAGRVVPVGDAGSIAEAVVELLRLDPPRRAALGEAARARVRATYALDVVARRFLELQREAVR